MKIKLRAIVAILLIAFWIAAFLTGYLVWLAPVGPRSGWNIIALGLMKREGSRFPSPANRAKNIQGLVIYATSRCP